MSYDVATVADEPTERVRRRAHRYLAQRHAARLLHGARERSGELGKYSDRLWYCGRQPGRGILEPSVVGSDQGEGLTARYAGFARCAVVWSCPVCADSIARRRGAELGAGFAAAEAAGYSLAMDTRTLRHHQGESLADLVGILTRAARRWRQSRAVKKWMAECGVVGVARALEVTHGKSGWHPHLHSVIVARLPVDDRPSVRAAWVAAVRREGGDATQSAGYDVVGKANAGVGEYLAKLGTADLSYELADPAGAKRTKGRTPAALLSASMEGDRHAGRLWLESVAALRGRAQIFVSRGLREWIGEMVDDEAAADDTLPEDQILLSLNGFDLARVTGRRDLRAALLTAAEKGEAAAFLAALQSESDASLRAYLVRLIGSVPSYQ